MKSLRTLHAENGSSPFIAKQTINGVDLYLYAIAVTGNLASGVRQIAIDGGGYEALSTKQANYPADVENWELV